MQTPSSVTPPIYVPETAVHRMSDKLLLLLIGVGVVLFHISTNGQYGFHRDELDILVNARQLDWGYVAYPPLTPFLARLELILFDSSLVGLRLLPALAQGVVVVLVGLMARDFGGGRLAQVVGTWLWRPAPRDSHCRRL
ncbi:MAG: hypothetical protein HC804_10530 [Anaerolineae bacterium]|nr:hypothetical protein [Anaerolineae bacterium]